MIVNPFGHVVQREGPQPKGTVTRTVTRKRQNITIQAPDAAERNKEAIAEAGRKAWSLLHRYQGCDPVFLEAWQAWIPRGCSCKEDFGKVIADYPPDFSSPEAFWNWGWFLHNWVNEKLGKPIVSLEDARKLWQKD
jgi:hypothetical protein